MVDARFFAVSEVPGPMSALTRRRLAILAESSLSFLGVGIQPPIPSWGLMIAEGKEVMFFRPWQVILPGIAIFLLVVGANLTGDGLRDITSPEGRN